MAGIVAAKILMNKRNVKGRVESCVAKVLAILDHDRQGFHTADVHYTIVTFFLYFSKYIYLFSPHSKTTLIH
jgi:hypothetical protein